MDFENIQSEVDSSAKIYIGVRVSHSVVKSNVIIGNFSRVDNSYLEVSSKVDRNNHLYHAKLGRYSYTGPNTTIMHASIGSFCSLSWNISIGGADHDYTRITQHSFLYSDRDGLRGNNSPAYDRFSKNLHIGSDVWISAGAVVTRGVTIGHGAVIGANSVVTKDVPPYAIVVGAPAKVVKYRFNDDIIDQLLALNWWDWTLEEIKVNYATLSNKPNLEQLKKLCVGR